MTDNHPLISYLATLVCVAYLMTICGILAYFSKYSEALGIGGVVVGLIGVMKMPSPRSTTIANTVADPVPVTGAQPS